MKRTLLPLLSALVPLVLLTSTAAGTSVEIKQDGTAILTVLGKRMSLRYSDFRDRTYFKDLDYRESSNCVDKSFPTLTAKERGALKITQTPGGRGLLDGDPVSGCIWKKFPELATDANNAKPNVFTILVTLTLENGKVFPGAVPLEQIAINKGAPHDIPYEIFVDFFVEDPRAKVLLGIPYNAAPPVPGFEPRGTLEGLGVSAGNWPPHSCSPSPMPGKIVAGFEDRGQISLERTTLHDTVVWDGSKQFFLPAMERLGTTNLPLCIVCGPAFISGDERCAIYLWSRDGTTRFGMMWWAGKELLPTKQWISADLAARTIAQSIFSDFGEEEFQ